MNKNELPDGWKLEKISRVIEDSLSGFACAISNLVEKNGYIQLRPFNIEDGKLNLETLYQVPTDIVDTNLYCLKKGDILFNNTNSTELVGKSALVDRDYPFAFSNHINRIRVRNSLLMPEYFYYYLCYMWSKNHFAKYCKKWIGQSGYTLNELNEQIILLPPISEQEKIVLKLDEQMAQIEIMKKEAEKQIVAVKDLELGILLKIFSNIDNSKKIKLKELVSIKGGGTPDKSNESYWKDGIYEWISVKNIDNFEISFTGEKITELAFKNSSTNLIPSNSLILATRMMNKDKIAINNISLCINQDLKALIPNQNINVNYLFYFLRKSQKELDSITNNGSTVSGINQKDLLEIRVDYVNLQKQTEIISRITDSFMQIKPINMCLTSQVEAINQLPYSILNEVFGKFDIPDEA